jgi:CheY-like chemotaxis protein
MAAIHLFPLFQECLKFFPLNLQIRNLARTKSSDETEGRRILPFWRIQANSEFWGLIPMARILLVDDNVDFRNILTMVLKGENHDVICAGNGNDALSTFLDTPVDLVITDLIMPDKEGLELIMELRRHSPTVKIVAMSGGGSQGAGAYLSMAKAFGVVKTLAKPFPSSVLLSTVELALGPEPIGLTS